MNLEEAATLSVMLFDSLNSELRQGMLSTAHMKLQHEADEYSSKPDDIEELADVFICMIASSMHRGWSTRDLTKAIEKKVAVNFTRTWHQLADGTWQHD